MRAVRISCSAFDSSRTRASGLRARNVAQGGEPFTLPVASSPSPARDGSTDSSIMSRTTRDSSRQTSRRSCPDSTARSASANPRGPSSSTTASIRSSSRSPSDETENRRHVLFGHRLAGKRNHLVQGALRVAHAAFGRPGDQRQRGIGHLDLLGVGNPPQLLRDRLRRDRAELEDLRPRQDRVGNLVQLGRRHHEDDVRRRLFDRLQQRVEGRARELMHLVDDEHLVAVARRRRQAAITTSRMLSMPVWLAASISRTSISRPWAISMQASHSPHGSAVGPVSQLSARARMRAVVVLPQPREPANTNACAMRPLRSHSAASASPPAADDVVEPLRPPFAREDLIGHESGKWK